MNENRIIYRSRSDQMVAGVCGRLAEWLDLDPSIVRLIFVLLALAVGHGILIYLILLLVMPLEPEVKA
ncbi:MAG: PspC domain-containing protein [Anaerolineaceae bacterium]|nr:PspC domain-containing protein [Anaerolineaceae bacterium]